MAATDRKYIVPGLPQLIIKSNSKGLRHLGLHLLLLVCLFILAMFFRYRAGQYVFYWCYAVVLVFLFAPCHESIHYTAFRTRWVNKLVAHVCGFVLILPAGYFRVFHLEHHRYTQNKDRDPELSADKPSTIASMSLYISGLPLWWERLTTTCKCARGRIDGLFVPDLAREKIIREARGYLAGYLALLIACVLATSTVLIWMWLVPLLIGQPMLRLYLLSEHTGCDLVADMLRNSRTTRSNFLVRWLAWNMPYHAEHHAYAAVPFHALPQLHESLKSRILYLAPSYSSTTIQLFRRALH